MSSIQIRGLFAATVTPVRPAGTPDLATFERLLEFLVAAGVEGVCLGGATAEYPHFDIEERKRLISAAARRLPSDSKLLVGVGCPAPRRTVDLGCYATDRGAHEQLSVFPTPWGIRLGLQVRGIDTGPLPLPMTAERQRQAAAFQAWMRGWLERSGLAAVSAQI
jgi:hypothetical protein